jgi:hypothetical protein
LRAFSSGLLDFNPKRMMDFGERVIVYAKDRCKKLFYPKKTKRPFRGKRDRRLRFGVGFSRPDLRLGHST